MTETKPGNKNKQKKKRKGSSYYRINNQSMNINDYYNQHLLTNQNPVFNIAVL